MPQIIWILVAVSVLSACSSTPKKSTSTTTTPRPPDLIKKISMEEIRQALDMESTRLGFAEKSFNSCALPPELRTSANCKTQSFTAINFELICRDTTGTTETTVTRSNTRPLKSENLEWVLGPHRGRAQTDSRGMGSVMVLSDSSLAKKRLVLKVNNKALGLTAEDVSKLVVPDDWCR